MALSRAGKNLAHNLMKGVRESAYMITEPGRGRKHDRYRKAVKFARETRGEVVGDAGLGTHPKNASEARSRKILTSRGMSREIKRRLPLKVRKY